MLVRRIVELQEDAEAWRNAPEAANREGWCGTVVFYYWRAVYPLHLFFYYASPDFRNPRYVYS